MKKMAALIEEEECGVETNEIIKNKTVIIIKKVKKYFRKNFRNNNLNDGLFLFKIKK